MPGAHTSSSRARFRARAFGWPEFKAATARLQEAISEIKGSARSDTLGAAQGIVALAERLWPVLQEIDTSGGIPARAPRHSSRHHGLEGWHLHVAGACGVITAMAAVADIGPGRGEEPVGGFKLLLLEQGRGLGFRRELRRFVSITTLP